MRILFTILLTLLMCGCQTMSKKDILDPESEEAKIEEEEKRTNELKNKLNISEMSLDYLEEGAVEVTLEIENKSDQSAYFLNILFDIYDQQGNLLATSTEQMIWRGTLLPNQYLTLKEIYFDFDPDRVYVPKIVSAG